MASTIILSDNGASSGSAGVKTTGGNDGVLILQTTTSGGTATNAVYVDTSQNVGIGTGSPSARLHVASSASGSYGAIIYNTSATGQGLTVRGGSTSSQDAFNVQTYDGGTSLFAVQGGGNVGIGTSSPSVSLEVKGSSAPNIKVSSDSNVYSYLTMNAWALDRAQLRAEATNPGAGSGTGSGILSFWTAGNPTMTERMRIDSSGNLLVGATSAAVSARLTSSFLSSSSIYGSVFIDSQSNNTAIFAQFRNGSGALGSITNNNNSAVAYNTSSDYRLKENIAPMTGALDKVAQLKPCTYTWKATNENSQGFIAHELQEVVPDCVTGEKDAVDADGNPVYQGIDTSFLVATLTAAIQEQQALITSLTERIAALEAK